MVAKCTPYLNVQFRSALEIFYEDFWHNESTFHNISMQ